MDAHDVVMYSDVVCSDVVYLCSDVVWVCSEY